MAMAYGCSHWVGGGNTPWAGRLSVLSDWQMYSKMTNMCMSLTFIWASSHLLFWQLSSSDLQLLVAKPWRRAFIVSLLNYVCWWGAQQPYILWRGLEKVPCCWQIEAKCLFYETHQCNSVTVMFFCFFLNIKQFDLTANYICITCYLFSFTLYKVKLKPVERLLKG